MAPQHSPWGLVQSERRIADGIAFVSTASHGGFWLNAERLAEFRQMFPTFRGYSAQPPWFEEDCDYIAVVIAFQDEFQPPDVQRANGLLNVLGNPRYDCLRAAG